MLQLNLGVRSPGDRQVGFLVAFGRPSGLRGKSLCAGINIYWDFFFEKMTSLIVMYMSENQDSGLCSYVLVVHD